MRNIKMYIKKIRLGMFKMRVAYFNRYKFNWYIHDRILCNTVIKEISYKNDESLILCIIMDTPSFTTV